MDLAFLLGSSEEQMIEGRAAWLALQAGCGFLLGFLLPPGETGFVSGKQLSLLYGHGSRLGSCGRSLAA
jgi:hypothetical protein